MLVQDILKASAQFGQQAPCYPERPPHFNMQQIISFTKCEIVIAQGHGIYPLITDMRKYSLRGKPIQQHIRNVGGNPRKTIPTVVRSTVCEIPKAIVRIRIANPKVELMGAQRNVILYK